MRGLPYSFNMSKHIDGKILAEKIKDKITVIATGFSGRSETNLAEFGNSQTASYRPSRFVVGDRTEEKSSEIKKLQKSAPPKPPAAAVDKTAEEEELEIPAFIRKKMK